MLRGHTLNPPSSTKEYIINTNYSIPGIVIYFDVKLGSTPREQRTFINNLDYQSLSENTSLSRHLCHWASYCVNFANCRLDVTCCRL